MNAVKAQATAVRLVGGDAGSRQKDDFYATPERATRELLAAEKFAGAVWEPACGDGAISRVLHASGHETVSSDLVDRGYGETGIDFLMEWQPRAPNIVTNPPFKLAVPFVRKALELASCKVAMLLKVAFLEGLERAELFESSPPARVHVFSRRLSFTPGSGGRKLEGGGMMAFAWFVWDHAHTGPPILGWLPGKRPYDPGLDALESYNVAVQAIGEAVKAGAPVPEFMLSRKALDAKP